MNAVAEGAVGAAGDPTNVGVGVDIKGVFDSERRSIRRYTATICLDL